MIKRIRRETSCVLSNISQIVLISFLTSLGGVLLWVNGGSTWFVVQSYKLDGCGISLTGAFVVSLVSYALLGAVMGIILKMNGCGIKKKFVTALALAAGMYIFSLAWYAVFFCTRLSAFSAALLVIAVLLGVALLLMLRKTMLLLNLLILAIEICEIYFMYVNISFILLI